MQDIEPALQIKDIMAIFGISQPTVYRWLAEARQGKSRFPLPINGMKRKLLWNRQDIQTFQHANSPPPSNIESAAQRSKRHAVAMATLKRHGVKVASM